MLMKEMSQSYAASAEAIHGRIVELRAAERAAQTPEAALDFHCRIHDLTPLWREMRELAAVTGRYYERSYHKHERYTL